MLRRSILIATIIILGLGILMGCSVKKLPMVTVAVIGDIVITEEQIKKEIDESNIALKIKEKLFQRNPTDSITPKDSLLHAMNLKEEDLSKEQKQYIAASVRSTNLPLTENEALNNLLRKEVLYQAAFKQGYEVSKQKALQVLEESDEQMKKNAANDENIIKNINEALAIQDDVVKEHGFKSWNDYQENRVDKLAQVMTINRMKNRFMEIIQEKIANHAQTSIDKVIAEANAWEDYTEFLLSGEKIKIIDDRFYVKLYGEPWLYGEVDLVK